MCNMKTNFSLISAALCLGFVFDATAAPSVRVLGSGAGYNKTTTAKTGDSISPSVLNAGSGATKAASIRSITPGSVTTAPVPRAASSRPGTMATTKAAVTKSSAERFPGISTKANVQSVGKVGTAVSGGQTSSTPSGGGYNVKEMNDRLTDVEKFLDNNAIATSKMSDYYYDKDYINANYFDKEAVQQKINAIDTSASSNYITELRDDVDGHERRLGILEESSKSILDVHTHAEVKPYVEQTFDPTKIDWDATE